VSYRDFNPSTNNQRSLGANSRRWSTVYSVDGSFSGNLTSEVGGSYKLYNLGTEGDTDTEYFGISWSGNTCSLGNYATGAGSTTRQLTLDNVTKLNVYGASAMRFSSSAITLWKSLFPQGSSISIGTSGTRFKNYFGQNGDFSGSVTTGGLTTGIQTVTAASDTLVDTDHTTLCDCTSNAITINLPTAVAGLRYEIKKIDSSSNAVTIAANGSETIDGSATVTLQSQFQSITIVSDGSNWFIV